MLRDRQGARAGVRPAVVVLLAGLGLAACGPSHPLGMSEPEWAALSPAQKLEARHRQADLDAARAAARAEREAEERRREAAERDRVAALYEAARFGDVVECAVEGGLADFHPGWRAYRPFVFAVARGHARPVEIVRADGDRTVDLWVGLDGQGTEVRLCHRWSAGRGGDCASIAGTSRQMASGVKATVSAEDALKAARVSCAYALPGVGGRVNILLGG